MASVKDRRIAAVLGAVVADAAVQPLHWVYDLKKLQDLLEDVDEVEFWNPSANPFYRLQTGRLSCYGDQTFLILKSLVESEGLNEDHLKKATYGFFGPNSEYENEQKKQNKLPITGPWRQGSMQEFNTNYEAQREETGSETNEQNDATPRIVPVVALYAGSPDLLEKAEKVIRILQNNDTAVAVGLAAARILEGYILNGGPSIDAVDHVLNELSRNQRRNPNDLDKAVAGFIRQCVENRGKPHTDVVTQVFKNNCALPFAFQSALHCVLSHGDFVSGTRAAVRAGGDCCSRSCFSGACMAAQYGLESIPVSWRKKTLRYEETLELAKKLVALLPLSVSEK